MEKGLLIILSGPSGVGKGTIRKRIMKNDRLNLVYSISMTTRAPRNMEVDGQDYYFVSKEEFQSNIDNNNFLEWAEFVGNRYGTPKDKVEELRVQGRNVFLEIEINGAEQVLSKVKDEGVISFFLMPPSIKALEKRIRKRKSEPEEIIHERLEKGKKEMTMTRDYDHIILNDRVGRAAHKITRLILKKIHELNLNK
ncbi:MAG TPA: guanylate kinase [Bacilli bacterium]|jgi:guanylate kinase|nr:guanylate kinase [Bacilli bacterium]HPY79570.1 guanylate kinase [Bacilli bacterium]HQA55955.1 guanylate kinase [Bacilli bacterium]